MNNMQEQLKMIRRQNMITIMREIRNEFAKLRTLMDATLIRVDC